MLRTGGDTSKSTALKPLVLGPGGHWAPLVLGPEGVPAVTDAERAQRFPWQNEKRAFHLWQ